MHDLSSQADDAVQCIRRAWPRTADLGIVLGTGSASIADMIQVEAQFRFGEVPHFPKCTAIGHDGTLLCGTIGRRRVIAMKGRCHLYEGYSFDQVSYPIHVFHRLGVRQLFATNAAGGVNPQFAVGDVMIIRDHLNLFFRGSSCKPIGVDRRNQPDADRYDAGWARADLAYDRRAMDIALQAGRVANLPVRQGVYVGLLGPTYETRAEYRMVRRLGGDAVGMSTIPEVIIAAHLKVPVLAASIITNLATPEKMQPVTGHSVVEAGNRAAGAIAKIFAAVIENCEHPS